MGDFRFQRAQCVREASCRVRKAMQKLQPRFLKENRIFDFVLEEVAVAYCVSMRQATTSFACLENEADDPVAHAGGTNSIVVPFVEQNRYARHFAFGLEQ